MLAAAHSVYAQYTPPAPLQPFPGFINTYLRNQDAYLANWDVGGSARFRYEVREKVTQLTRSDNCQGCHAVINPLGFSLEHFDAVGRYRTEDTGRAIDAASDYADDEHASVRLAGARDVAEFAIASERANRYGAEAQMHR